MAVKADAKQAIKEVCSVCGEPKKYTQVATGKKKIVLSCACGVFDKRDNLLYKWNRD